MKSIFSILVISVCIAAYFVYIKPLSVDVKALTAKKAEYTHVLNSVKEIKEKRDEILAQYDSISQTDIEKLNKIIPAKVDDVKLLNDLNNIGSKYGMIIKDFKSSDPNASASRDGVVENPDQIYKTTNINFTISGPYNKFLDFLSEVESGLSLLDVTHLVIKQETVQGGQQILSYVLEANVYSLR